MLRYLPQDIKAVKKRDPAARNLLEVWLCYPGVHAIIWHRIAHGLWKMHLKLIAKIISSLTRFFTGIEIHPGAKIGPGFFIDHGMGVIIGETTEIGKNVTLYQGTTLGGTGKETGKRHPTLGDNVVVASGAKVLGPFKVGDRSKIGAGAVVLKEVPPDCTVVGIPGRIVRKNGIPISDDEQENEVCDSNYDAFNKDFEADLDQVHLPDPIMYELEALNHRIKLLEQYIEKNIDDKKENDYENI